MFRRCKPEILNSDQGSHYTCASYQVPMDGKGRATDNSSTERLFRALDYEDICLSDYETPRELRKGISQYVEFYHNERPHQSLIYAYTDKVYSKSMIERAS